MIASLAAFRQSVALPLNGITGTSGTVPQVALRKASEGQVTTMSAVSAGALAASDLFDAANTFVRSEHLETFSGFGDRGSVPVSTYVSVEKYNDYVFDKAASLMVINGKNAGLSLVKDDIISALRLSNSDINSIKDQNSARVQMLGPASMFAELSISDLRNMTDMYIATKEQGLDEDQLEIVAVRQGMSNRDRRLGVTTVVYDPEKEKSGYGDTPATDRVSPNSIDQFDKLKTSLYGSFGLSTAMINLLVDSVKAGDEVGRKTLNFIQSLLLHDK